MFIITILDKVILWICLTVQPIGPRNRSSILVQKSGIFFLQKLMLHVLLVPLNFTYARCCKTLIWISFIEIAFHSLSSIHVSLLYLNMFIPIKFMEKTFCTKCTLHVVFWQIIHEAYQILGFIQLLRYPPPLRYTH